ncbi:MAG: DMT family transporter [Firmicutes bacterium]|nr:DMT family transporter [Bacillota bacterium]
MTQTDIKRKNRAMLLMVITAAMWSLGGIFIKLISWSPFLIAGIRSGISGSIMAMYMAATHTRFKLNKYSLLAGVGLAFSATLFTIANKLTTAANAIVLQYTAPIFILIISAVFFKQKMQKQDVLVVCITMGGMVLFFLDQLSPGNMLGNLFGILAGIFLAQMFVMVGRGGDDDATRMSGIMIAHVLTLLIGLPIGIPQTTEIAAIEIVYVIILGVFQLGIPYVLYGIASRDCPPLACSLIGMLEPLLNPVWVAIFIGEVPGPFALVGAVIIIATVSWWCIKSR